MSPGHRWHISEADIELKSPPSRRTGLILAPLQDLLISLAAGRVLGADPWLRTSGGQWHLSDENITSPEVSCIQHSHATHKAVMSSQCSYMYCYQKLWLKYISTSNHNSGIKFSFKISELQLKITWNVHVPCDLLIAPVGSQSSENRHPHIYSYTCSVAINHLKAHQQGNKKTSHPDNRNLGRINMSRMWRYTGNMDDLKNGVNMKKNQKAVISWECMLIHSRSITTFLEKAYDNWLCDTGLKHQLVGRLRQRAASSRLASMS